MSIIPLISSWERFLEIDPTGDLAAFGRWLATQAAPPATVALGHAPPSRPIPAAAAPSAPTPPLPAPASPHPIPSAATPAPEAISLARESLGTTAPLDTPGLASILMARLNNINVYLAKPAIRKLGFAKDVEFGVLIQVYLMGRPNKKELCRQLLIGDSTGVEVTRRLARKGYLRETVDPNDRRASRLSITEKGQRMLKEGSHLFYTIHREFLKPLLPEEQLSLVALLTRLHDFHSGRLHTPGAGT